MEVRKLLFAGAFLGIVCSSVVAATSRASEPMEVTSNCVVLDKELTFEFHDKDYSSFIYFECSTSLIKVHLESKTKSLDDVLAQEKYIKDITESYLEMFLPNAIDHEGKILGLELIAHASEGQFIGEQRMMYEQ